MHRTRSSRTLVLGEPGLGQTFTQNSKKETCTHIADAAKTEKRPARYFAFEVPHDDAEVTIRLESKTRNAYLELLGPVNKASESAENQKRVNHASEQIETDDDGYNDNRDLKNHPETKSTNSRIDRTLDAGVYVIVATEKAKSSPASSADEFTLTVKIPYPKGSCAKLGPTNTTPESSVKKTSTAGAASGLKPVAALAQTAKPGRTPWEQCAVEGL